MAHELFLADPAPAFFMQAFALINGAIALSYGLLAIFFAKRLKLPPSGEGRNWLSVAACAGAMIFFIGCAHTHIDLAYWAATDNLRDHWYSWWNVLSHLIQAIGGLTFWVLATFYLQINIFDKRHYDRVTGEAVDNLGDGGTSPVENQP